MTAPSAAPPKPLRVAHVAAFLASVGGLVSIAVSQGALVLALAALALRPRAIRFPRVMWPLLAFSVWTVIAAWQSPEMSAAMPQFKKFLVYLVPVMIYSAFRRFDQLSRLIEAWFVVATTAALVSLVQFAWKWLEISRAGADFEAAYMGERITGYFSHWLTFSEVLVLVFAVLLAYLLFSTSAQKSGARVWWVCAAVIGVALVVSYTRSVWLALGVAGLYLVASWRRELLWGVPVLVLLGVLFAPAPLQRRVASMAQPDQNSARIIMWQTGANMVDARPWFGVGPERVRDEFENYMPERLQGTPLPEAYYGHLHNMYIHYAAERGWPAALIIVWLLCQVIFDQRRVLRGLPAGRGDRRAIAHAAIAATLAVAVVGFFDLTLGDSEILGLYLAIVTVGYGACTPGGLETA